LVGTDVSGLPIGPIFKGQAVKEECVLLGQLDPSEDVTDKYSRNVGE